MKWIFKSLRRQPILMIVISLCGGLLITVAIALNAMSRQEFKGSGTGDHNPASPEFMKAWRQAGLLEPTDDVYTDAQESRDVRYEWGGITRVSAGLIEDPEFRGDVQSIWSHLGSGMQVQDLEASSMLLVRAGWPFRCLEGGILIRGQGKSRQEWVIRMPAEPLPMSYIKAVDILPSNWWATAHVIGYRPLPIPLLASVILYAIPVLLLLMSFVRVQKQIRQYRGRCMKCGYDLKELPSKVCPECGEAFE